MEQQAANPIPTLKKLFDFIKKLRQFSFSEAKDLPLAKSLKMSERQCIALYHLDRMLTKEPQGVSLKALAQRLQITIPATSLLVDTMVSNKLFERRANPEDRRGVLIQLAPKGTEMMSELETRVHGQFINIAQNLNQEELDQLDQIVDKLFARAFDGEQD